MIEWRNVPFHSTYEVSNTGLVRNKKSGRVLKASVGGTGYRMVTFKVKGVRKNIRVHRLVALAFLGDSNLQVNHKDCNKLNNNIENLEYCTSIENTRHYISMGKANYPTGEKAGANKYSRDQILLTLIEMKKGRTPLEASRISGVHKDIAYLLRKGKIWKKEVAQVCTDRK